MGEPSTTVVAKIRVRRVDRNETNACVVVAILDLRSRRDRTRAVLIRRDDFLQLASQTVTHVLSDRRR